MAVMYLDKDGAVTTGIGNLIDPIDYALNLPWTDFVTGAPASQGDIMAEWEAVKKCNPQSRSGFWNQRAKLRLSTPDIDALVLRKVQEFEAQLKMRRCFSLFDEWPADAQLGLLSMAWAMGGAFNFPKFEAAAARGDFMGMAGECKMDDSHNPGLTRRNIANIQLFTNAYAVKMQNQRPDVLYFPRKLL